VGFFDKLKAGLEKTRQSFTDKIEEIVTGHGKIDEDLLEDLEFVLLSADVGVQTTEKLIEGIRLGIKNKEIQAAEQLKPFYKKALVKF
jgi:fused signal recognition particle receptor